jgi:hypothetical protein
LGKLCSIIHTVQKMVSSRAYLDKDNVAAIRAYLLPLWQYILAFALGVRLSKSVIEVGSFQFGPPGTVPSSATGSKRSSRR